MTMMKIGISFNMLVSLLNLIFGSVNYLIWDDFNSMIYNLLLAIISMLFAIVLVIVDLKTNEVTHRVEDNEN